MDSIVKISQNLLFFRIHVGFAHGADYDPSHSTLVRFANLIPDLFRDLDIFLLCTLGIFAIRLALSLPGIPFRLCGR